MHHACENTKNAEDGKPEIVLYYNKDKAGVDNLEKLVKGYLSMRKSRRWPYSVVFTLIDVAVVASHKLIVAQCASQDDHYKFKKALAYETCKNLLLKRQRQPRLHQTVHQALQLVGFDMVCVSSCGHWSFEG